MIPLKQFKTYILAKELYAECLALKLPSHIKDQMQRAALSICLNLAEGNGRRSKNDRIRFFNIAFASAKETQAVLDIISNAKLLDQADHITAMIYRLIAAECRGAECRRLRAD